jgi:hypothetical protein
MQRLPMDRSRVVLTVVFSLAGLGVTWPSGAAAPTLSPQVQAFVTHAQPLLAITHVRVIDGHGTSARENQTVLLRDGRIAAIGNDVELPPGCNSDRWQRADVAPWPGRHARPHVLSGTQGESRGEGADRS